MVGVLGRCRMLAVRNLFIVGACLAASLAHADIVVGSPPPDYLGKDEDGKKVLVSEQRGKLVIVSFFASWCGPCRKELPILASLQKKVGRDKIVVVAVNSKEDSSVVRALRRDLREYQLTVTSDSNGKIGDQYGVKGIPRMVIIGKDGNVAAQHVGYGEAMLPRLVTEINQIWREEAVAK